MALQAQHPCLSLFRILFLFPYHGWKLDRMVSWSWHLEELAASGEAMRMWKDESSKHTLVLAFLAFGTSAGAEDWSLGYFTD